MAEITLKHYERIRDGLRVLQGGALGRWGFYHQTKDAHTGSTYRNEVCYAGLERSLPSHAGEILYIGFNPYNGPGSSSTYHRKGAGETKAYRQRANLEWLKMLVGKNTPFPNVLPHLYVTNPSQILDDGGFIVKDFKKVPNAEFNCFIICARLCYEYGPSMDTYLFLRDRKHTQRISALMATGMRPKGQPLDDTCIKDTWELFSPSHTYIGGNITGYAYRWLYARPDTKRDRAGLGSAYGTSRAYCEGQTDLYGPNTKKTFPGGVAECIAHLKAASEEQRKKLGDKK